MEVPNVVAEYVGLRAKMYSYVLASGGGEQKAKGVPKAAKKQLSHAAYKQALLERVQPSVAFQRIASKRHKTHVVECQKSGINCYNDKVYQLSPMENRPLGHRCNANYQQVCCDGPSLIYRDDMSAEVLQASAATVAKGPLCWRNDEIVPRAGGPEEDVEEYQESSAAEESDGDAGRGE